MELGSRSAVSPLLSKPKIITLGGDHSLALPALRALNSIHGKPLRVLHFDGRYLVCLFVCLFFCFFVFFF